MSRASVFTSVAWPTTGRAGARLSLAGLALWCCLLGGCAAFTNPIATGVSPRRLSLEFRGQPREALKPIPLELLRQPPPDVYRIGPGDVLGIWIEGILGERNQPPPVHFSDVPGEPAALGYPIPVRDNGTISIPQVQPIRVEGLTIPQVEDAIRDAYTVKKQIIQRGQERITVTLQRPRQYSVTVVREDGAAGINTSSTGGVTIGTNVVLGTSKRGTGTALDLPAYKNDVLNALSRTGGLPGLDARNEVLIERGGARRHLPGEPLLMPDTTGPGPGCPPLEGAGGDQQIIRIPLRLRPGEEIPFRPEDVILRNGDIVYIPARDTEVFYTGGLLGSGQYVVPRDYDLDVVEAVALVHGPFVNGGVNVNNLSGSLVASGLGSPSPSLLTVLRRTPDGGQVRIKVDLNKALQDPRERVLVQPKDVLVLQEQPSEALTRYLSTTIRFNYLATLINRRDLLFTSNATFP